MFKRARWFGAGVMIGCGGTVWAQRKARNLIDGVLPSGLAQRAGSRARALGTDVRDALAEGRMAMRARERELRSQIERPPAASRRLEHPSVAHDHPSNRATHLHVVTETPPGRAPRPPLTAEEQARRR